MAINSPEMIKHMNLQIQKTLKKINLKKSTARLITAKLLKTKDQKKNKQTNKTISKAAKEKGYLTFKGQEIPHHKL